MSMAMDAADDDDDGAGGCWRSDPLYTADLAAAAIAALRELAEADRAYFEAVMSELDEGERDFLKAQFEAAEGGAQGTAANP